ncbi:MAG: hypothetical protein ACO3JL_04070 [Myxococcota bacterium]
MMLAEATAVMQDNSIARRAEFRLAHPHGTSLHSDYSPPNPCFRQPCERANESATVLAQYTLLLSFLVGLEESLAFAGAKESWALHASFHTFHALENIDEWDGRKGTVEGHCRRAPIAPHTSLIDPST